MKTIKLLLLLAIGSILFFNSCREESIDILTPPVEEALQGDSRVATLMNRTVLFDGSDDNIIDGASCLGVVLPVTVIVNGEEIVVEESDDFDDIEDILDEFDDDNDTVEIVYPITIILPDHSEEMVNSNDELVEYIEEYCVDENEIDDDIECIDFVYPITASVFDENNELVETITINNDAEFYEFLDELNDYEAVSLNFPIEVILSDGNTLQVNNLQELEEVIDDAEDDCDEDDDNDFDDDDCEDCSIESVVEFLTSCEEWYIDDLERNDEDLDNLYSDFVFSFGADSTIVATNGTETFEGLYILSGEGNNIEFDLIMPDMPELEDQWNVHEIELEDEDGDDDREISLRLGDDELSFESECFEGGNTGELAEIISANGSTWIVANYSEEGVDQTAIFDGYEFNFNEDTTATAERNGTVTNGEWASNINSTELLLNFGTMSPLDELEDTWDVVSFTENRIEVEDVSGGNGDTDRLVLEKL